MTTGKNPEEKLGKQKPVEKEQVDCQAEHDGGARAQRCERKGIMGTTGGSVTLGA